MSEKKKVASKVIKGLGKAVDAVDRISPLSQKVDNSKITDTGTESVKQINSAVRSGKRTVKTVRTTVKTTKRTVKTIKNAPKNIKRAAKVTVKIIKATVKVLKAAVNALSKVISFLISNPIVLLILLIIILVAYIVYACVLMFSGASAGEASAKQAFSNAAGLEEVPKELKQGADVVKKCRENIRKEYDKWIDSLYFEDNDDKRRYSDLVYMERFDKDDNITEYQKGLASDTEKQILKDALDWSLGIDDIDILSIAYVAAQKDKNNTGSDKFQINIIKYTDDIVKKVTDKLITYYDSRVDERQRCPGENCYIRKDRNPEWDKANRVQNKLLRAYQEWHDIQPMVYAWSRIPNGQAQQSYWDQNLGWRIDNWNAVYANDGDYGTTYYADTSNGGINFHTRIYDAYASWFNYWVSLPEYIETHVCENAHKCYSKGLEFYSKDEIISLLGFDETEKLWEQYTEIYFRSLASQP